MTLNHATHRLVDSGAGAIAVVGGCGYIGSHIVRALEREGRDVVVIDDLSTGQRARVDPHPVHELDVSDATIAPALAKVLAGCSTVIHLAAHKKVPESVADPLRYYGANIDGVRNVLAAMASAGTGRLVFSSTAAVYGPSDEPVAESAPPAPVNPYGRSKLAGEWLVADAARAYGLATASLRYFNVAGAETAAMMDDGATSLLPRAIAAVRSGRLPEVFGTDYPTRDGSAIRDYVHVRDVADAHVAVATYLEGAQPGPRVLNVGTGTGVSVLELLGALAAASGTNGGFQPRPRREGDLACSTARVDRIAELTGWRAERGLEEIVADAWQLAATS